MSLAEQLKKLQIPGQAAIQQLSSKKVSFLFDPHTAASLDNETIQEIGYTGFNALVSIDNVFSQFEQLFDTNSVKFQRNMENESSAMKIKKMISNYLILLSPYFQLKPAQKSLEWLVRRYQSHIWDKEDLIACLLPFHETNAFGRAIQLFGNELNNDEWDWLLTCQKEGKGFSMQALVNQCMKDRSLLSFICKMAEKAKAVLKLGPKSQLKIIFSFHACVVISVIEGYSYIEENMVSFMLPHVHAGLESDVMDYICSTYMIIAGLSCKVKLMKDVRRALLCSILKSLKPEWYEEGLLCFLNVLQHQKVKLLSSKVLRLFFQLQQRQLMEVLISFEKKHDTSILLNLLILALCRYPFVKGNDDTTLPQASSLLRQLVDNLTLSEPDILSICQTMIQISVENPEQSSIPDDAKLLLVHLSKRYSLIFDQCLREYFKELDLSQNEAKLKQLKRITTECLFSEKHSLVDSNFPLMLSLNHPEASVRVTAVNHLFSIYQSDNAADKEFIVDSIMNRLNDDHIDVVKSVLKYSKDLINILDESTLVKIVLKLILREDKCNLNEIIAVLVQSHTTNNLQFTDFYFSLFGYLISSSAGEPNESLIDALSSKEIPSENPFFKGISNAILFYKSNISSQTTSSEEKSAALNVALVDHVADAILSSSRSADLIQCFWDYTQNFDFNHDMHFIRLLLLLAIIEKQPKQATQILQLNFSKYIENCELKCVDDGVIGQISGTLDISERKSILLSKYHSVGKGTDKSVSHQRTIETFITILRVIIQSFFNNYESISDSSSTKQKLFIIITSCSMKGRNPIYHDLLNIFFAGVFRKKTELLSFLCSLYQKLVNVSELDEEHFQAAICSLHITKRLLNGIDPKCLDDDYIELIMCHFALLSSSIDMVREVVLDNIHVFSEMVEKKSDWRFLLKEVNGCRNELLVDPNYTKVLWQQGFDVNDENNALGAFVKKSKKCKEKSTKVSSLKLVTSSLKLCSLPIQVTLINSLVLVEPKYLIEDYLVLLKQVLSEPGEVQLQLDLIVVIFGSFQADMVESLDGLWNIFVQCMNHENTVIKNALVKLITPSFFDGLSSRFRNLLLIELLNVLQTSKSVFISSNIRIAMKALNLSTGDLSVFLTQFCESFDTMFGGRGDGSSDVISISEKQVKTSLWQILIELLETILCQDKVSHLVALIPFVFNVFERCLKCSGVEYVKQLLLSTLLALTKKKVPMSEGQFKVELIVQCLQSSSDMETTQQSLKVLSNAAQLFPTQVLHNILHIFSFMGGTMIRLDNAHSFQIMEETMNAIVPVLIKNEDENSRKRLSPVKHDEIVKFIVETFVDALPHCPEHRRFHIIKHLVDILQKDKNLHIVLLSLLKKVVSRKQGHVSEEQSKELSPITIDFCKDLMRAYSISEQVSSLYQIVSHMNNKDSVKLPKKQKKSDIDIELDQTGESKKKEMLNETIVRFVLEVVRSDTIQVGYEDTQLEKTMVMPLYSNLIEEVLLFIDGLGQPDEAKRRIKSLHKNLSEVVSQLCRIIPFESFVVIMCKLLAKENDLVRKKSVELLCEKLQALDANSDTQEDALQELFSALISFVKYKETNDEKPEVKQMMLQAIQLVAKRLGNTQTELIKAVPIIAQLYSLQDTNEHLCMNAMICMVELVSLLKKNIIPYLPIIMKPIFQKTRINSDSSSNTSALVCGVTVLHKLLQALPNFCSPYVSDFILNVSSFSVSIAKASDAQLTTKIATLKADIGKLFPPRILLPAIKSCFESLLIEEKQRSVFVVDVFKSSLQNISKADANANYSKDIVDITKTVLDSLTLHSNDWELCESMECLAIEAFNDLTLKLTENSLRPMFLELLNWATEVDHISLKILSFFRLSLALSKSLRSLFLLFAGHILKNAKDILSKVNTMNGDIGDICVEKEVLVKLVKTVIDTLNNCFLYDCKGYMNKERFESIMLPLVNQMENKLFGDDYLSFMQNHLSPCLVNFSVVVNETSCWKQLNHQILTRTKSEYENVRFTSLYVLEKVVAHMGESYLILIPETIPFLAEILEDDSQEVEKQCQKTIKVLEDISGESIQKYL